MFNITKPTETELQTILDEITSVQEDHAFSDEVLYKVASDETREEYFTRMFKCLKMLHKDMYPELYGVGHG